MHGYRTHTCGELRGEQAGQEVRLSGWVFRKRDHGSLLFIDLRDHYGLTQVVVQPDRSFFEHAQSIRLESVITVTGRLAARSPETVNPDMIELEANLNHLGINQDQLIVMGILTGTDYNPKGIPGIGQKKALAIVRQFKQPVLIFKEMEERILSLSEEDRFEWQDIFELFHKPDVKNFEINFPKLDEKKIKEILVEKHDFSDERIENQLKKLRELNEKKKQKTLEGW